MKKTALLIVSSFLVIMFQNCAPQQVSFKAQDPASLGENGGSGDPVDNGGDNNNGDSGDIGDGGSRDPGSDNGGLPPSPDMVDSEQFQVTFSKDSAPMDMVWVIDNSGSMKEEAAHVRNNFTSFLTELNKRSDFRLLLISQQGSTGYAVEIPSQFDKATHLQVNQTVGSHDGPDLLFSILPNTAKVPAGFLRANAKKVIVFVTDDNSTLSAESFQANVQSKLMWSPADVSVTSFIGLGKDKSPCQYATGVVYQSLAMATGGQNYNICDTDWSGKFADLINTSVSKAMRRFTITRLNVKSVTAVSVDGVVLDKSLYSFDGRAITLADSVVLKENSIVAVGYSY